MIVCASCRALILAVLGAAATPLPFFLEAQPERPALLAAGAVLERRLAGGESHSYCLEAIPGARLLITVEQRGIDVEVLALRPDGTTLAAVDGPTDSEGPESLLLPADVSGPLEIKVHSPSPGAAPGAYRLRLEEVPESTPAERERVAAERLMTEAAAHNREGTGDSLRLGAARYEEAQGHWHALGQPQEEARCALSAGAIEVALGQPKPALERYQQALARFVELADEPGQAASWSGIGIAQTALGDAAGSVAAQRRALALEQGLGRPYEEGKVLNYLGLALHSHGELREALDLYQRSLGLLQRAGEQGLWKARVLHNLAAIYIDLGEPEAALQSHRQVLALQRAAGDRQGEAQTLNNLGVLFNNLGELGKALEAYAQALAIFRQSGDRLWEASLRHNLGVAYYGV
ncbi:MAG TPA: tetratricopeptide repeat protein, partial [Thermoanaerobaculia bacterium]|nr:tetratricopeptide repeat protein [Thermoanaerobaculia bacterium]